MRHFIVMLTALAAVLTFIGCGKPPQPVINGPSEVCQGGSVTLTAASADPSASTEGWTYEWSTGDTTPSITVTPGEVSMYTVTVKGKYGKPVSSPGFNVTVNPPPAVNVSASGPLEFCGAKGEKVTLDAGAGFASYQWMMNGAPMEGATAQTHEAAASGAYSVKVSDAKGCSGTSTDVTVNAENCPAAAKAGKKK